MSPSVCRLTLGKWHDRETVIVSKDLDRLEWPDTKRRDSLMGKRVLYVGGLPETVSDCALRDIFTSYGLVARAYVVRFKHTGRSAGYGFVEMGSGEQAVNAVAALAGTEWEGHPLRLYVTPYANQAV
jgi:RNA recognition motif-containing protein